MGRMAMMAMAILALSVGRDLYASAAPSAAAELDFRNAMLSISFFR